MHLSSIPIPYIRPALYNCSFRLNINFATTLTLSLISPVNLRLPCKSLRIHPSQAFGPLWGCGPSCGHCTAPSRQSLACSGQPLSIPALPVESRNPSCLASSCLCMPSGFDPQPSDFTSDLQTLYPNPGTLRPTSRTFMSTSGTPFPLLGPSGPPSRTLPCQNCGYCRGVHLPRLQSTPLGPSWPNLASCQTRLSGSPASVYSTQPGQPQI